MNIEKPEAAGFTSRKLNSLSPLIRKYVDDGKVPGIILMIARRKKMAFAEAYGVMDITNHRPMPMDGIFRLASMTKPVTAVAALILYEEGAFEINDPVSKFLPEFHNAKVYAASENGQIQLTEVRRPIIIEDLFTHQAGLPSEGDAYPIADELKELYRQANLYSLEDDLATMTTKVSRLPLCAHPGEVWRYSVSFDILAHLVEVIAGMPFSVFLKNRIFDPLGMVDTGFFVASEKADRLVRAYNIDSTGLLQDSGDEEYKENFKLPRLTSGSGNLLSTAMDYQRFAQMLANGGSIDGMQILGRKTIQFMAANRLQASQLPFQPFPDTSMAGYGMGLGVRVLIDLARVGIPASLGEFGWSGWFGTGVWIDPAEQLSGVLMAQVAPPVAFWPHIPPLEIRRIVYQAIED
jgi:CubicO group peptidase (beta-lactamase class C family)